MKNKYKVAIVTLSDKGSKGERKDISGEVIKEFCIENNYEMVEYVLIPDEKVLLKDNLLRLSKKSDLIITTGGTGLSKRDITPEVTLSIATKNVPGISEAIRANSMQITKRAMLSRGASVLCDNALIINLPGSPKAVKECLDFVGDSLEHALDIINGNTSECARH